MSAFTFIDRFSDILEDESLTAFFTLKGDEEFLKDHFEGFPVMPGVLLLETLKQACCRIISPSGEGSLRFKLAKVEGVKFGQFVKPGSALKIFAKFIRKEEELYFFEGNINLSVQQNGTVGRKVLTAKLTLAPHI